MTTSIKKIFVAGSGAMGHGIALSAAQNGCRVWLNDVSSSALQSAEKKISATLAKLVEKQKISASDADGIKSRVEFVTDLGKIPEAELVIEAITEDLTCKQNWLNEVNQRVTPQSIVATNTSSLSVTLLASGYAHPDRFLGLHFFNPVPVMKLVEVIPAMQTSGDIVAVGSQFVESLGKVPATVKDVAGFAVNRILVPMINEAFYALYEGVADAKTIDQTMQLGANHPMGPLTLGDFVGLDVILSVLEIYQKNLSPERYKPCPLLRKLVEAGRLGRKSGKGVFEY